MLFTVRMRQRNARMSGLSTSCSRCGNSHSRLRLTLLEQSLTKFVQNATNGTNAVLRNLELTEDDAILITNQTFGAVKKLAREVCQSTGSKLLVLNITYPTVDFEGSVKFFIDDIVQQFKEVLQKNSTIKLTVVDYIGSSNAVLYPVKELIDLCHHAPAQCCCVR